MTNDFLPFIDRPYRQSADGYHFNSDTVLLGLFLPSLKGKSVLDIGTQAGALLLYAAAKGTQELCGIDINEEACALAGENLRDCQAEIRCCDLKDYRHPEFDVILCNPPFYVDSKRQRLSLEQAMNRSYMPAELLFGKVRSLLKSNGSFYMIYPASGLNELQRTATEKDFSLHELCPVYDGDAPQAVRMLLKWKRGNSGECRILSPRYIREGKIVSSFDDRFTFRKVS